MTDVKVHVNPRKILEHIIAQIKNNHVQLIISIPPFNTNYLRYHHKPGTQNTFYILLRNVNISTIGI